MLYRKELWSSCKLGDTVELKMLMSLNTHLQYSAGWKPSSQQAFSLVGRAKW